MLPNTHKDILRWHLHVVFLYYASYADRNNYKLLKTQNYRRFLIDSETVQDQTAFAPFDIAFRKIHTTSITHQQFQQLIPTIAQLLFPKKNRKEAFNDYVSKHLQKLYHQVLYKSEFGQDVLAIENLKIQHRSLQLLQSVPIRKAYSKYIESTSMHQKSPAETFQHLHIFLNDFEISPKLIYKAMTYLIFYYLLSTKDNSSKYGLEDFKNMIVCIAELYWRRVDGGQKEQEEKIVLIIQQMELSEGFKKMVDKTLKESAVMVSFFKRNTSNRLNTEQLRLGNSLQRSNFNQSLERQAPKTAKYQNYSSFFNTKRTGRKENLGTVRELLHSSDQIDLKGLKSTFEKMCSHGEVANTKTLKSIKIKKYFQSISILQPLSQTWIDLKIADICRTSPSGKIQFPHFLQLLLIAAKSLSIPMQSLLKYIIDSSYQPAINTSYSTKETKEDKPKLKTISPSKSTIGIFYQVEKQLEKIFLHYSSNKRELTFERLSHLLYQFDVFPAFITKVKLYKAFQQFAHSRNQIRNLVGEISLDLEEFLQVLHSISVDIGQNLSNEEQALFMLERMQDSVGHRTILGSQGSNLIGDLRSRYSGIYLNATKKAPEDKIGFDELIQAYEE